MTAYMGSLGSMVPLRCASQLRWSGERPMSTVTTMGGRQVAYVGPRTRREWSLSIDVTKPHGLGAVQDFAHGYYGRGPFWWVSEWAAVVNILPPRVAAPERIWRNASRGGPVILPDGIPASQSLIATGSTYVDVEPGVELRFPVFPGVPVTGAAWLGGANQATRVEIRDAADQVLDFAHVFRTGSGLRRTAATVTPGALAHHAVLRFINPGRIVNPSLTYTEAVADWGPAAGCDAAIVQSYGADALMAAPGSTYGSVSYGVMEVGP